MRTLILLGSLLLVTGCGSSAPPSSSPGPATAAPTGLFDAQRQALDKARQVNQQTQNDADAQRQAIEHETQ